jgi:hypothetical protein
MLADPLRLLCYLLYWHTKSMSSFWVHWSNLPLPVWINCRERDALYHLPCPPRSSPLYRQRRGFGFCTCQAFD